MYVWIFKSSRELNRKPQYSCIIEWGEIVARENKYEGM